MSTDNNVSSFQEARIKQAKNKNSYDPEIVQAIMDEGSVESGEPVPHYFAISFNKDLIKSGVVPMLEQNHKLSLGLLQGSGEYGSYLASDIIDGLICFYNFNYDTELTQDDFYYTDGSGEDVSDDVAFNITELNSNEFDTHCSSDINDSGKKKIGFKNRLLKLIS